MLGSVLHNDKSQLGSVLSVSECRIRRRVKPSIGIIQSGKRSGKIHSLAVEKAGFRLDLGHPDPVLPNNPAVPTLTAHRSPFNLGHLIGVSCSPLLRKSLLVVLLRASLLLSRLIPLIRRLGWLLPVFHVLPFLDGR